MIIPKPYNIRELFYTDVPGVVEIERICFIDPWPAKWFMAAIQTKDHCVGAFDTQNKLVAYAISVNEDDSIHLANIAVDPDHRRNGIGRILLDDALQYAVSLKARKIFLEVRISNDAAINLYQSAGFTVEKIEEEFYSDAEDALILVRNLDGMV